MENAQCPSSVVLCSLSRRGHRIVSVYPRCLSKIGERYGEIGLWILIMPPSVTLRAFSLRLGPENQAS